MKNIKDLTDSILVGNFDSGLGLVIAACRGRQNQIAPPLDNPDDGHNTSELAQSYYSHTRNCMAPVPQFRVGMKVRFNQHTNPTYLRGTIATITKVNPVKVQVRLDIPMGRFGEGVINVPTSIIEVI
jgi:hypothetical protein